MQTFSANDLLTFEHLISLKQPTLLKTMGTFLKSKYDSVVTTEEYVYAIGDIPVALVAHLDTVFTVPPKNIYFDQQKNVLWSSEGLGADDRAGVFAIIKIICAGLKPHIIFTTDEEVGAIGAATLVEKVPQPFAEMKYIIQLDRRGVNDCVFYDCDNSDFIKYIEKFGFVEAYGSFSDISEICPIWKVAGVNLSIGYQNEHSIAEILHIDSFLMTIKKVINMLQVINDAPTFQYIPSQKNKNWENINGWYRCKKCKNFFTEYELFPVKGKDGKTYFYCPDCIVDNINWCAFCGKPFETLNKDDKICADCQNGRI